MELPIEKAGVFAEGLDHPEGIAVHPDGTVWAGGEAGQIYQINADGSEVREVANTGGFNLGIAFSPGAEWMAICDLANKCVWRLDLGTMELSVFAKGVEDHQFNIPNYAVFDKYSNLYVSESGAFREVKGKILKFNNDGKGHVWHQGPFDFANGMALGPRGTYLYVVSSFLPGVERISILGNGRAGEREVFCTLPETVPDGIAFDNAENLYVSCYIPNSIYKIMPDRTNSVLIHNWDAHTLSNPTNIAFGGEQFDKLFTTNLGRWHITKIDVGVEGYPLASHGEV